MIVNVTHMIPFLWSLQMSEVIGFKYVEGEGTV